MPTCTENTSWYPHQSVHVEERNKLLNMFFKDAKDTIRSELRSGPKTQPFKRKLYGGLEDLRRTTTFIAETGTIV
ncbi:hypothetical protein DPMN_176728 [Dreissena polymorpha]|uniref:Uncharacterized protein n=1 Tax=Dreissena polymorpha TaxID=45954 RepID=A0A9D4IJW4_DREPO|nr:hypothetical protein DPMN_176728 [Dreissena polymorpha]